MSDPIEVAALHVWRRFADRPVWNRSYHEDPPGPIPVREPIGCMCPDAPWRVGNWLPDVPLNDWHLSVRFGDHRRPGLGIVVVVSDDEASWVFDGDSGILEVLPGRAGYVAKLITKGDPNYSLYSSDLLCPRCRRAKVQFYFGEVRLRSDYPECAK